MKEKYFRILLLAVLAVCIAVTAVHIAYDVYSYGNSSIIYYISKELW